jgi:hypothetical protein
MSTTVEPWRGVDCGWLAVDRDGHVAVFYTGGEGPIREGADPYDEAAEDALREMAETSQFELLVAYPRPDDFVEAARRGLYAYDWSDVHRSDGDGIEGYELVARPDRPIHWTELPEPARTAAAAARMEAAFGVAVLSRFAITD